MKLIQILGCALLAAADIGVATAAPAADVAAVTQQSPTAFLLQNDSRVGAIVLRDSAESLNSSDRARVRELLSEVFDFRELTRRSLGDVWDTRTEAEQLEFVRVNRGIIERRNLDLFIAYHRNGGISYTAEQIDADGRAVVTAHVPVKSERKVISYALHRPVEGGNWRVYDLIIDGASTVEGNRRAWTRFIGRNSFEKLLERLRTQLTKLEGTS